ncbi:MAG: ribonuclease P protein component [Bacteroidales bacterium]
MSPSERFLFPKSNKLSSIRRITEIFRNGAVIYSYPFKVLYLQNEMDKSRVVISVPKRIFKRAVKRNYIKRVIRESLRIQRFSSFSDIGFDICIIFTDKELPSFNLINQKIQDVLGKIIKRAKVDSRIASDTAG